MVVYKNGVAQGISNTDAEIRDGVWSDSNKAAGADITAIKAETDKISPFGGKLVTTTLTWFDNAGQISIFTVTGKVIVRIIAVVTDTCGSTGGCNVSVGIAGDVDAIIPVTDITLLAAEEIWHDATPDSEIESLITIREYIITDGNDITVNSSAADNNGAIQFCCFWTAISSGASVVAA